MPIALKGSCHCGAVRFTVDSHSPYPYMRCYCSICRQIGGGGGFAINIMGVADTLRVEGRGAIRKYNVMTDGVPNPMERTFCKTCSSALWGWHPDWPELVHPFASAIDSDLPVPPTRTHIMLHYKAPWVEPDIRPGDKTFPCYPDQSIEDWHRAHALWIE